MKNTAIAFLLLALSLPLPLFAQASDDNCNSFPDVPVTITPTLSELSYDYSTGIAGIKALKGSSPGLYEQLVLAAISYKPDIQVTNYPKSITLPDGSSCVKITAVEIKIDFQEMVAHIAAEIPQDSCGYSEVMAHVQKHVDVLKRLFSEYTPVLQTRLQLYLKNAGIIQGGDYGNSMEQLHNKVKELVNEAMQEMGKEEVQRHQQVDAPQEFQRLRQACNGQLGQIVGQSR